MSKALAPIDALKKSIQQMGPQFKMALPKHIDTEKFTRVLMTAVSNNPALLDADRSSLFAAMMKSAEDGLIPDGKLAALVTFKSKDGVKVQYMPMVAGILRKVRNSGELASITSQLVYKNDKFKYWVDSEGEHLEHEPNLFSDRGEQIGVYALAKTKDGAVYIEVLTMKDVTAIKNSSRAKDFGPWAGEFAGEMQKKSAIRRLAKRLPSSSDIDMTISADDEIFTPPPMTEADVTPQPEQIVAPKKSKVESLVESAEDDII